jgi:hypothetical protein
LALGWVDEREVPAKARLVEVPWPVGLPLTVASSRLGFLRGAANGDRAALVLTAGGTRFALRVVGSTVEVTALGGGTLLDLDVSSDGAVAFSTLDGVWHWGPRGPLTQVVSAPYAGLRVAPPTKEGVPVLATDRSWAAYQLLPFPAQGAPVPTLSVGGFARSPLVPARAGSLPACASKPAKGAPLHRFALPDSSLSVSSSTLGDTSALITWVRASERGACIDGVTASKAWPREVLLRVDLARGAGELASVERKTLAATCKLE